jgi:UDP-glucuronate 4-epimerase
MKIIVTGCSGFIGSHLCEKLLKMDYNIIGIDNNNNYYSIEQKKKNLNILKKYNNFIFLEEDILNTKAIIEYKPDKIIHLAAMAGVRYSIENPLIYCKNNIEAMINLLDQNKELKIPFIYASSSSVYGNNKEIPFKESHELKNIVSPYAASKLSCEIYAQLYNNLYKIPTIGLRFFTVYGPRGRPDMAPYKFLKNIYNQTQFIKYGNGESFRDYTYIDDIVDGILSSMNLKHNSNHIFNLGNNTKITLNEFIHTCEIVTNKKANFIIKDMPKGDVIGTYANLEKSNKYLNYKPKILLQDGLKKTLDWMIETKILT